MVTALCEAPRTTLWQAQGPPIQRTATFPMTARSSRDDRQRNPAADVGIASPAPSPVRTRPEWAAPAPRRTTMAKYLLLKHYRGAPEPVNSVPMDQWTPE